jgi:uncharacterized membrane protein
MLSLRTWPLLLLAVLVLLPAARAHAQASEDPVCAAYRNNWEKALKSGDKAAITRAAGAISRACPALRSEAANRVAKVDVPPSPPKRNREANRGSDNGAGAAAAAAIAADDAAFAIARQTGTLEAFQAYLSSYPYGRHADDARALSQPLQPITVAACNRIGEAIYVQEVYLPTGEARWRYKGSFEVQAGACVTLFDTKNRTFYLRAETVANTTVLQGSGDGDIKTINECAVSGAAYDFTLNANEACPSNALSTAFISVEPTISSGAYTFNFNATSQPAAAQPIHVQVCDRSGVQVTVAADYRTTDLRWASQGWWVLSDGQCLNIFDTYNTIFDLYATSSIGNWVGVGSGVEGHCTQNAAFLVYSDQLVNEACPTGYVVSPFLRVDTGAAAGSTYTYTFGHN